jgi:hypothetical protein
MVISSLSIGGKEIVHIDSLDRHGTNLYIPLQEKLLPGRNLTISVQWSYKFATEFLIMGSGKSEGNTYFVSYWYPQVAVYDDISGWDDYEYKGMVEFYNDFSDYDVTIKVPSDFIVWSTGVLQNPREVLSEKYAERYQKALASDDIVSIVGPDDRKAGNITTRNGKNLWHYKADNIPDFTFGTSDRYLWDMTSLIVDHTAGRRAMVSVAYDSPSKHFSKVAEISRRAIEYFSDTLPGVPYPFPSMTIFQGTFAMECPMMVNIRVYLEEREWLFINTVIHEILHSYFPFYMGTNERKYGFMDEGWAHMLPMEIQTVEMNKVLRDKIDARTFNNIWNYEEEAGTEKYDRPPAVLTIGVDGNSSHVSNHNRPGAAYYFLQDMLGKDLFKKALLEFMRRWHHKHPVPSDFFNTFNEVIGENLSWYWKPWFFEFGYPDLTIKKEDMDSDNRTVFIRKSGNIPIPIKLTVTFEDSSEVNIYKTARVWESGNTSYSICIPGNDPIVKIVLGDNIIPDVDRSDNIINFERELK